jgi:hypothetical protein
MDHIDEVLTTQSHNVRIESSIWAALSIAKKTLNNYYDKTDYSEVYQYRYGCVLLNFDVY